jgi:hypothetical protein
MTRPTCPTGLEILHRFRDTVPGSTETVAAWLEWRTHKAGCDVCSGVVVELMAAGESRPMAQDWREIE